MATTNNGSSTGGGTQQGTENGLLQHKRQVVHVRENSDSAMEDLFSVINNPQKITASSFRQKNLPKSFFSPPDPNRNSRENLLMAQQQGEIPFGSHPGLVAQHSRSRSSPATLPNSLSLQQQQQQQQANHRAQHSVDFTEEMQMPQQWADRSSHRYMLNSPNNQQQQQGSATASPANSQWSVNAQKSLSSGNLVEANNNNPAVSSSAAALSPASSHGPSPATSLQNLNISTPPGQGQGGGAAPHRCAFLNLPGGWDISLTPDNEIYYINHLSKTTDWYHPTLPRGHQGPGPMKLSQLPLAQQQQILQHQQLQQQAQLLQQQQQQQQLSPPQQQQLTPQQRQQHLQTTSLSPPSNNNNGHGSEEQIFNELKRLQKEKERLQREQEDISKREHLLKTYSGPPGHPQTSASSSSSSTTTPSSAHLSIIGEEPGAHFSTTAGLNGHSRATQEMMLKKDLLLSPAGSDSHLHPQQPPASVGIDPFLGQPAPPQSSTATLESHARQNSADSGLGGMGTNYSLPRTPEDFLSNVEEMDSSNDGVVGGQKLLKPGGLGGLSNGLGGLSGTGDFGMDTSCGGGGQTSMDIGALGDIGDPSSSIGDDLMSTLQDDMMTTDLLNDADLQKDLLLNQTWL